jgi:hypothetical protein
MGGTISRNVMKVSLLKVETNRDKTNKECHNLVKIIEIYETLLISGI